MRTWTTIAALCAALLALAMIPGAARALTADEVLQLRQAGVSDATIQQMLENEHQKAAQQHDSAPSAALADQKFANDHIGSWTTSDGRVVLSTGRADPQRDVFDPTVPQNPNDYSSQTNVYPYVFPGAPIGPAPVLGPHGPVGGGGMGPR